MPPPPISRPLFLVGTVRSGSTLVADVIGRHPSVAYVGFELSEEWTKFTGVPMATPGHTSTECPPMRDLDGSNLVSAARDGFARLFDGYLSGVRKSGHCHFLNKNPHLSNKLGLLRAVFPDASLIVTARDVRSTVASTKAMFERQNREWGVRYFLPEEPEHCWSVVPPARVGGVPEARVFPGGDPAVIGEYWLRTYEAIDRDVRLFDRAVLARHRDLLADPRSALGALFGALGLSPADVKLPPLDAGRNSTWRSRLSEDEADSLDAFVARNADRIRALEWADSEL
jgi:hypothetical protein